MVVCPNSWQTPVKYNISPQKLGGNYLKGTNTAWCPWAAAQVCPFLIQLEGV